MSILFYSGKSNKANKIVQIIMEGQASGETIEICSSNEDLSARLRQPRGDLILVILVISSQKELMEMLLIRDLLADMPIILILPGRKKKTIDLGHKFCPRFLSYIDSDFSDVAMVLNKMMSNAYAKEKKMRDMVQSGMEQTQAVPHPN